MGAGAVPGGIDSAITGSDIGLGMLTGAVGAGIGSMTGSILPDRFGYQLVGRVVSGAISGGVVSQIYGGNFWQGFAQGAGTAAAAFLFNHWVHEGKVPWLKQERIIPGQLILPAIMVFEGAYIGGYAVSIGGYCAPEFAALTVRYGTIYILGNPNTYQFIVDFMQGASPTLPPPSIGGYSGGMTKWLYDNRQMLWP
jgi:hypothetical protein